MCGRRSAPAQPLDRQQVPLQEMLPARAASSTHPAREEIVILPTMANIDRHEPGSFCWIELGTTDQNAAKSFYTSLFGWSVNDFPMGPGQFYSMFGLEGRNCGAAYTLDPKHMPGVPPNWALYICVASADETAAKAASLGGKVLGGPFDVMEFGRMAVIQDPTGAVFDIWQPKMHQGLAINSVPGTLCWADLS